jgi:mono/diheme cytochrome c family protein
MNRRLWEGLGLGLGLALLTAIAAAQEASRSVQSGVFTAAQAERGAKVFQTVCQGCHQPEEFGDGAYMDGWSGQMASDMIEQIRSTMPQDNPGSLKRPEYVDIAAFLFQLNALPTGDAEMDVDNAKNILIEGPYGSASNGR